MAFILRITPHRRADQELDTVPGPCRTIARLIPPWPVSVPNTPGPRSRCLFRHDSAISPQSLASKHEYTQNAEYIVGGLSLFVAYIHIVFHATIYATKAKIHPSPAHRHIPSTPSGTALTLQPPWTMCSPRPGIIFPPALRHFSCL